MSSSSNSSERDLLPLLLFALSAKVWIDRLRASNHGCENRCGTQFDTSSFSKDDHFESTETAGIESDESRRKRRNLRLSIDSPSYSEHHFSHSPLRSSEIIQKTLSLSSINEAGEGDKNELTDSITFLNGACPRWRELMEKVSIADSVLTRDVSMDFKTKNSNWCHFEGFQSPSHEEESEDEDNGENEDFPWSDPPSNKNPNFTQRTSSSSSESTAINPPPAFQRASSLEVIRNHNATIMPNKLILIRHGQSEGNVDETLYSTKADNAMRLTKLGWDTARMAGRALRDEIGDGETIHFVVSPYVRTVETFHGIVSAWVDPEEFSTTKGKNRRLKAWYSKLMEMGLSWHEDPRIREQDFGNYQDPEKIRKAKSERHKFGSFYYRFPHGESASDVFDRVSTFLDSLWRSFETQKIQNYVLVTHGISIRVFLARYFRYSIDQFNMLANPKNCEMVILKHDGFGRLQLDGRCEVEFEAVHNHLENNTKPTKDESYKPAMRVVGYTKHQRLKLLPPHLIRPRSVQMWYRDTGV